MADLVGFYSLLPTSDKKGLLGALLVTDDLGKPEEFRVTYPVRPTLLQRQLYGDSLVPHVAVELCGKPLLAALAKKPQLLVVDSVSLLGLGMETGCEVIHIERLGEKLALGDEAAPVTLRSPSNRFQPLGIAWPYGYDDEQKQEALDLAARFFAGVDLIEPFARIQTAVEILSQQDERFR